MRRECNLDKVLEITCVGLNQIDSPRRQNFSNNFNTNVKPNNTDHDNTSLWIKYLPNDWDSFVIEFMHRFLRIRGEREFPFPAIPGNTGLPFPFPKIGNDFFIPVPIPKSWESHFSFLVLFPNVGNAIFHYRSQYLGMGWVIPVPKIQKSFPLPPA